MMILQVDLQLHNYSRLLVFWLLIWLKQTGSYRCQCEIREVQWIRFQPQRFRRVSRKHVDKMTDFRVVFGNFLPWCWLSAWRVLTMLYCLPRSAYRHGIGWKLYKRGKVLVDRWPPVRGDRDLNTALPRNTALYRPTTDSTKLHYTRTFVLIYLISSRCWGIST